MSTRSDVPTRLISQHKPETFFASQTQIQFNSIIEHINVGSTTKRGTHINLCEIVRGKQ